MFIKNIWIGFIILCVGILSVKAQTEITFYTSKGNFKVKMFDTITPITSGNFIYLVNNKFYDGLIFHRVINNFVIQGGCPLGTGYGGPGYTIPDEFDSTLSNIQKTISMANSGPNTGGSQFFINLVDNTFLDFNKPPYTSAHPVFGIVIENFSLVEAIGAVPVDTNDKPITNVVMDSLRVTYNPFLTVNDINKTTLVRVFPNPAKDFLFLGNMSLKDAELEFYNICGQKVLVINSSLFKDNCIDVSGLANGLYMGKITMKNGIKTFKFLKN